MHFLPFDHPLPTLFPAFPYEAWGKRGLCLASPAFRPLLSHLSRMKPGGRVGFARPFPPVTHSYPTLAILLQWFENS